MGGGHDDGRDTVIPTFGDDVPPLRVGPVITDQSAWVAATVAEVRGYLTARACARYGREVPVVRLAGALLGVAPLGEAIDAIVLAMMPTAPLDEYEPCVDALAAFAEAVNHARRRVYEYTDICLFARRAILLDWGRKVSALTAADEEEALSECNVVVAEAECAAQRLLVFEEGVFGAIEAAEDAAARGDVDVIVRLMDEVRAAGDRHSAPSTQTRIECE